MFRIDGATAGLALPAPAAAGMPGFFLAPNPGSGTPGTLVTPDWLNTVQEELEAILAAAGLVGSKTSNAQVLSALVVLFQARLGFVPVQQGTGVGQLADLVKLGWKVNGKLGLTIDVTDLGNVALEPWATAADSAVLASAETFSTTAIAALQLGFKNLGAFSSNGTFVVPANVFKIKVRIVGGGGPGGGGNGSYGGAGGGAGGYVEGVYPVVPGQSYPVTAGAAGLAGAAGSNNGSPGGTTSFGTLCSATGGTCGAGLGATSSAGGLGGSAYTVAGGFAMGGGCGGDGNSSAGLAPGGNGGASPFGGGGRAGQGGGVSAGPYGAGGGACYGTSGIGGNGQVGLAIVEF